MGRLAGNLSLALAAFSLLYAASAQAAPHRVFVLDRNGVHTRVEAFAGQTELPRVAAGAAGTEPRGPGKADPSAKPHGSAKARGPAKASASAAAPKRAPRGRATRKAIDALLAAAQIDQATRDARQAQLRSVLRTYTSLSGTPKAELGAVIDNTDQISAAGNLTPSRLNPVFATLAANQQWWKSGKLLSNGARVSLGKSQVIWQYYRGQGIQLQMLANFGKANALWSGKKTTMLRNLLNELVPLATDRGGWPAWEYFFQFGGGKPPWTSSISQGTAVQVFGRAGQLLGDPNLTYEGALALAAFEQQAPNGVRVDRPEGAFYAIYSFAPTLRVMNAHLQALVGLYDFAQATGDGRALTLFQQGDAWAQANLPAYDTGKWSLYDQNRESDLSYHKLVTGFLKNLCTRTAAQVYCDKASAFNADLKVGPAITLAPQTIRTGKAAKLAFDLDKISHVGLVVQNSSGTTVYSTSAVVGRGSRFYNWSRPSAAGTYTMTARATDLNGNSSEQATTTLRILPRRR